MHIDLAAPPGNAELELTVDHELCGCVGKDRTGWNLSVIPV